MKTKAAVLRGVGQKWQIEEVDLGDPVAGEVQVRLTSSGLCHSDHHLVTGAEPTPYPIIGGHEGAGVITKVGKGVTHLQEGDHVVTSFIPSCGKCRPCAAGFQNVCDDGAHLFEGVAIADRTFRVTQNGTGLTPMALLGTFSPYITVHEASLIKIENDIPLLEAALLGCCVGTGWGSVVNGGPITSGDTVAVVGIGGVGINAVQGAAASGARYVIAIDPVEFKRDKAREFGATHTFASIEEAIQPVRDLSWGRMANVTAITVGDLTGDLIQPALELTAKLGTVVVTAVGSAKDCTINLYEFTMLQKRLQGAIFGGKGPRAQVPELLERYRSGDLKLTEQVTRTYKLEDVNEGYDDMFSGKNIRGVIEFTDADF